VDKSRKKSLFSQSNTPNLPVGGGTYMPPYIGETSRRIPGKKDAFSPIKVNYPQFSAGYPQMAES
jgi:hypothetical protein